jgi:hypothetical protein
MFDYFKLIENKYINRLSVSNPIVIRLDGKDVCGNPDVDLLDENIGGFAYALIETGKFFSRKYRCIVYVTTDEINIVVEDANILKNSYKKLEAQKISSLVSQEVFMEFNRHYKGDSVLFDARSFNIYENKINSYLLHRIALGENVLINHFAKGSIPHNERANVPLKILKDKLHDLSYKFRNRSAYQTQGSAFLRGVPIEILDDGYRTITQDIINTTIEDDDLI